MNKRVGFGCLFFALIIQQSFATFQFSSQNSTITVGSAKFLVNTPLTNWTGTLAQTGSVRGSNAITFSNGILQNNVTPCWLNAAYVATAARPITLNQNQLLRPDHGQFVPALSIIRGGNRLEGSPIFQSTKSINLTHQLSSLTIATNCKITSDITLNGGTIILDDDLNMGDDRTLTGSGTIVFNRKRLVLGGSNLKMTSSLTLLAASDLTLNADLALSGILTFTGPTARINGNGNVLDLSSGGTLWIRAGTTLYITDLKIKGLGKGFFVFENQASQLRMSQSEIEMATNYTVTQGGIYVDTTTNIVTKNNTLTFANSSTLTVDGVTLWYDTTISPNSFNIQPSVRSSNYSSVPNGKNIATINNGRIAATATADQVRANSNALLYGIKNNSNAIINLSNILRVDSNAFAYGIKNNSNAIINLSNQVRTNSNANAYCCRVNSNAIVYSNRTNSNAIVNLSNTLRVDSNAFAYGIKNNSNALLYAARTNSNAIINLSNQVRTNSNANAYCCRVNSNAIVNLSVIIRTNSNAALAAGRTTSNAIVALKQCVKNNSNAIIKVSTDLRDLSAFVDVLTVGTSSNVLSLLNLIVGNSIQLQNLTAEVDTLSILVNQNSNAIISLSDCCLNNSQRITNNSNAIINLDNIVRTDSNAFAYGIKNNSNGLVFNTTFGRALLFHNSNAIVNLNNIVRTDSNAFAFGINNNSNALIYGINNNSNAILALKDCCLSNSQRITNNSNAIVNLDNIVRTDSNAFAFGIKNNSNALLYGIKNNSNALLYCCRTSSSSIANLGTQVRVNSNAIVNLNNIVRTDSNAFAYGIKNNSNSIININSMDVKLVIQNSNAIISLAECCLNNSQRITNNSNAIVNIVNNGGSNPLINGPLTSDVTMTTNVNIPPLREIDVQANLTINGQGAWIEFDESPNPQFTIAADTTVTLSNVSLLRVNNNTFNFGANATLAISGLVVIEISDDVTFTTENVVMLGTATNPSILIIRASDNSRVFTIEPIIVGGVIQKTWNIGINTLEIQNVHLVGVESIQATSVDTPGGLLVGQVALGGNATVDIAQDTDLSFGVEHINNSMRLLANNLTLNNFLLYSPFFESQLHLKVDLPTVIVGNPVVNFADNLLFLSGVNGSAGLIFDDYWVTVFNQGVNSFDADANSFISGRNLEIENFPIKQSSSDLVLDSTLVFHTTLPNAIDSSFIKAPELSRAPGRPKIITALSMMYEQSAKITELKLQNEYDRLERVRKEKEKLAERKRKEKEMVAQLIQQKQKPVSQKPKKKNPQAGKRELLELENIDDETLAKALQIIPAPLQLRSFVVPETANLVVKGSSAAQSQASGSVVVSNGTIDPFGANDTLPLTLFMIGDATLLQADPPDTKSIERMTRAVDNKDLNKIFNNNSILDVQSDGNTVKIKQDSQMNGTVIALNTLPTQQTTFAVAFAGTTFDPDLLFIPTDGSSTTFARNKLTLPDNSRVEFTGNGTLWIQQGFFAALNPTTGPVKSDARTTLAFTDGTKVKFNRKVVPNKLVPGTTIAVSSPFAPPTQNGEQVTIEGIGAVKIDLGAQMLVETGQRLVFGEPNAGRAPDTNIALSLNRLGVLSVDTSAQSINNMIVKACPTGALISMQFGTYSISLNEGAILNIGCCGTYGINWDSTTGVEAPGTLTSFTIKNRAVLNIERTGRLVMGRNLPVTGTGSNSGLGGKFLFDPFGGLITGNGIVALGNSGFEGVIQQVNAQPEYVTAQGFVRSLINTVPALQFATVFVDTQGNQKLFNAGFTTDPVTGKIKLINNNPVLDPGSAYAGFITLMPGDKIVSDDPVSGNVYGFNRGQRFTYTPDGTRVNN